MKQTFLVALEYIGRGLLVFLFIAALGLYVFDLGYDYGMEKNEGSENYFKGYRAAMGVKKTLYPTYEKGYDEGYRQGFMHGVDAQGYGKGFREAYSEWQARCETWREDYPRGNSQ